MILYDDHLKCALSLAIGVLQTQEKEAGLTGPSAMLSTLKEAFDEVKEGKHIEIQYRSN